jgi:hypothetical protein
MRYVKYRFGKIITSGGICSFPEGPITDVMSKISANMSLDFIRAYGGGGMVTLFS